MKLGIIGTNWITVQFVQAAEATGAFTLAAVYSRRQETAQHFVDETHDAAIYTDLEAFFASPIDVVYIASPNGLHAGQAIAALKAGKHAIVEKPMVTDAHQLAALEAAQANYPDHMVFEAARQVYDPNFAVIKDYVAAHRSALIGATLTYAKYSSRYDAYLAGKDPNIFSPRFGGGALMDLGVYSVYVAVGWFGMPQHVVYLPDVLKSGVDGSGVASLTYDFGNVTLLMGKNYTTQAPSEIYFGKTTLAFGPTGVLDNVHTFGETAQSLSQPQAKSPMADEAAFFAKALTTGDRQAAATAFALAKQVHTVMSDLRATTDIRFNTDPE
ncbi:Gfo/Idh/MocA family protein [Lacticaseibacillus jixianensis]|uniref:Gfo/Idh/MocA family protein n=1 Tax=Lacticaseibacillus jixianensis TaxID=2486012 RepID=A0ABW4B941_9LACO|nr:Gfo/Idh/MocA family oxidoreductase [Lacticaseibacillus jixianensis]